MKNREIKTIKQKSKTDTESKIVKSKILRIIIFCVGIISFVLGTIGTVLPVLPTVPFYLLTAFCFVRSSEKFHNWFLNSKLYKKHLQNFAETKCMILLNEMILLLSVSAMLMCTIYFVNNLTVTIILSILIACKYSYFIFQVKPITKKEFKEMQLKRIEKIKAQDSLLLVDDKTIIKEENSKVEDPQTIQTESKNAASVPTALKED